MELKPRFQNVSIGWGDGGWCLLLDQKNLRSPAGHAIALPNYVVAKSLADEFAAQSQNLRPDCMPMTQIIMTSRDRVMPQMDNIRMQIQSYAATDAICYWAGGDENFVKRQKKIWGGMLQKLEQTYGMPFHVVLGLNQIDQPQTSLQKFDGYLKTLDAWQLTILMLMTGLTGSALTAWLWMHEGWPEKDVFDAGFLPETYRAELAGDIAMQSPHLAPKWMELQNLARFRELIIQSPPVNARINARIHGRVQGVGFRAWVCEKSHKLSLAGFVRNRGDGTVECEWNGNYGVIIDMLNQCLRGPDAAIVTSIAISDFESHAKYEQKEFLQIETI